MNKKKHIYGSSYSTRNVSFVASQGWALSVHGHDGGSCLDGEDFCVVVVVWIVSSTLDSKKWRNTIS